MENKNIQAIKSKKYWLKRYRKNQTLLNRLEDKLRSLDYRLKSVRSPQLSDMPRGGTPVSVEDLISDKLELEDRIAKNKLRGKKLKKEILAELDTIDDVRYTEVLESFFIECMSIEEIAEEKGYSVRHVYKLYSDGIEYLVSLNNQKNIIT